VNTGRTWHGNRRFFCFFTTILMSVEILSEKVKSPK
jgi:hypothetical protein